MAKSVNIKQFGGQRAPGASLPERPAGRSIPDFRVGTQTVDLLVKFKIGTAGAEP